MKSVGDSRSSFYCRKMCLAEDSVFAVPTAPRLPPHQGPEARDRGLELKLKYVVLLLGQFGHLLADGPHKRRGGEAAQRHVVHVFHQRGQVLLGDCAVGGGGLLWRTLVVL